MPPNASLLVIAGVVAYPVLLGIYRRREGIRHTIRRIILAETVFLGVGYLLTQMGWTAGESLLGGLVVGLIVNMKYPARSRHVPAAVRRRKVAEWELEHGRKFNSQRLELDHGIPFSRFGSHTADNLRVVERKQNRSKGKKSPWWDLLGR